MISIKCCSCVIGLVTAAAWSCAAAPTPQDDASAWVVHFVDALADPTLRAERADEAVQDVQRLLPLRNDDVRPGCQILLTLGENAPSFMLSASFDLIEPPDGPCAEARLGLLHVTLKTPHPGRDIVSASRRLTELFGPPVEGQTGHNHDTHWQVNSHVAIEVGVSDRLDEEGVFSITLAQVP